MNYKRAAIIGGLLAAKATAIGAGVRYLRQPAKDYRTSSGNIVSGGSRWERFRAKGKVLRAGAGKRVLVMRRGRVFSARTVVNRERWNDAAGYMNRKGITINGRRPRIL